MTGAPVPLVAVRRAFPRRLALVAVTAVLLTLLLAAVHLTQGTGGLPAPAIWSAALGGGSPEAQAVLQGSRLPRLLGALLIGAALGVAGCAIQSVSRNLLASPDTLAVNAGAQLAVTAVAAFGIALPALPAGGVAFGGGLASAAVVLALGGRGGPLRTVLAGSALALALGGVSGTLMLLFALETASLYAWGNGSLLLTGLMGIAQLAPVAAAATIALLLLARRLDLLGLGDDAATAAGSNPVATRVIAVVLAVLLSAVAVTLAGPMGFVGLAAPALVRLGVRWVPGLIHHRALLPVSGLLGAIVVVGSDVLLRAVLGAQAGAAIPTGLVTSVFGAVVLVLLAVRTRDQGSEEGETSGRIRSRRRTALTVVALVALLVAAVVSAVLLGDAKVLLGDVGNWLAGRADRIVGFVLDTRIPRVAAAVLAGAAFAVAGAVVQSVTRNPLADPGILGVSGGAALGAIIVVTAVPVPAFWAVAGSAIAGGALAAALVFGLAAEGGLELNRLVLVGIGVQAGTTAFVSLVILSTDVFSSTKALTWLAGSTYGREADQLLPVAGALVVGLAVLVLRRHDLDLLGLDADTPRLLGLRLGPSRTILLAVAVLLTATAVAAAGTIGFVGLLAPHAARALAGARSARVVPVSALLGAVLVSAADTIGRTAIAPAQIPVGLVTAVLGAPYFLLLLRRMPAEIR